MEIWCDQEVEPERLTYCKNKSRVALFSNDQDTSQPNHVKVKSNVIPENMCATKL